MTGPVISNHREPSLAASALAAGDTTAIPNGRGRSAAPACVAVYPRPWMPLSLFGSPSFGLTLLAFLLYAALSGLLVPFVLILNARLLLGGAAGDRYGRRRLMNVGILLFGFASLACAVTPTLILLLIARFVQRIVVVITRRGYAGEPTPSAVRAVAASQGT